MKVTPSGVREAVRSQKRLKQLDYKRALLEFFRLGIVRPRSQMTSFNCSAYGDLIIERVVTLSPDTFSKCTRIMQWVFTNQLIAIVDLSLDLIPPFADNPAISFSLAVEPFLTRCGHSLRNIALGHVNVNIFFITFTCPLVKRIELKCCRFIHPNNSVIPRPEQIIPP